MNLSKDSFLQFVAHILMIILALIVIFPHFVQADSPDGRSTEQPAALAEASNLSGVSLDTGLSPAQTETGSSTEMSPAAFLLLGSLGLGLVGGVSVMVLRMGPDK